MVIGAIKENIKHLETESVTGDVRKSFSKDVTFEKRPKGRKVSQAGSGGKSNI